MAGDREQIKQQLEDTLELCLKEASYQGGVPFRIPDRIRFLKQAVEVLELLQKIEQQESK